MFLESMRDDIVRREDLVKGLGRVAELEDIVARGEVIGDLNQDLCWKGFERRLERRATRWN